MEKLNIFICEFSIAPVRCKFFDFSENLKLIVMCKNLNCLFNGNLLDNIFSAHCLLFSISLLLIKLSDI